MKCTLKEFDLKAFYFEFKLTFLISDLHKKLSLFNQSEKNETG